jgi:N-acetylmuramoyl-L-alanine amidase
MGRENRIVRELRQAGFRVLTRKQWGSRHRRLYQWRRIHRHFPGRAKCFFAHVTVTNRTDNFAADVRLVERIGYERFGTGISYNYAVDQRTGTIAIGMPHDAAGAHTLNDKGIEGFPENLNYFGHAIAWIGNVGDRPSQDCKDAFSAIIAAEKKHNAARDRGRIYPHSKFAWKECPLTVMTNALPAILEKSKTILKGDWFDMATKKELREVVDAAIEAKIDDIVRRVLNRELPQWAPEPYDPKENDTMPLWQQVHQARGYAEAAYRERG